MPAVVRSQVETHGSRLSGKSCGRALDRECGRVLPMPPPGSGRDVRLMERDGRPVAILVHDSALSEDGKVMDVLPLPSRGGGCSEPSPSSPPTRSWPAEVSVRGKKLSGC